MAGCGNDGTINTAVDVEMNSQLSGRGESQDTVDMEEGACLVAVAEEGGSGPNEDQKEGSGPDGDQKEGGSGPDEDQKEGGGPDGDQKEGGGGPDGGRQDMECEPQPKDSSVEGAQGGRQEEMSSQTSEEEEGSPKPKPVFPKTLEEFGYHFNEGVSTLLFTFIMP